MTSMNNGTLIGQVELTRGNIDNNHIYLRSFFDRFPAAAVGGSNRHKKAAREVSVDWGGASPAVTDLDGEKRFFRSRAWVRDFFEINGARPGDVVSVEELAPFSYRVRLVRRSDSRPE
jgi:DNA polymerase III subunit epsilon